MIIHLTNTDQYINNPSSSEGGLWLDVLSHTLHIQLTISDVYISNEALEMLKSLQLQIHLDCKQICRWNHSKKAKYIVQRHFSRLLPQSGRVFRLPGDKFRRNLVLAKAMVNSISTWLSENNQTTILYFRFLFRPRDVLDREQSNLTTAAWPFVDAATSAVCPFLACASTAMSEL